MTKKAAGGMSVFVVTDVADEKVANILDEKFNKYVNYNARKS